MTNAVKASLLSLYDPVHLLAQVRTINPDGSYIVDSDGYLWTCQRAASCLLVPQRDDTVLISGPNAEHVYLIAVIKQAVPTQSRIQIQGELQLEAQQISVTTEDSLSLISQDALLLQSEQLQLASDQAHCLVNDMQYVGKQVQSQIGFVRLLGKVYESIVDRLNFMSKDSYKVTENIEHSRAGTLDIQAEQSARIHANYTMLTGKDLIKVDAKQIHMG